MTETTLFALIGLAVCGCGYTGWLSVHRRMHALFWSIVGLLVLLSGMFAAAGMSASGWDGLIYAILLVLGCAPSGAALFLGGGVGLLTRKKYVVPS